MTTTTRTRAGKTPEQRKLEAEALHAQLVDQVELLTDSDRWREFLDFSRSFHRYRGGAVGVFEARECVRLALANGVIG